MGIDPRLTRSDVLKMAALTAFTAALPVAKAQESDTPPPTDSLFEQVTAMAAFLELPLTEAQLRSVIPSVRAERETLANLGATLPNSVTPAFDPVLKRIPKGTGPRPVMSEFRPRSVQRVPDDELLFLTIPELRFLLDRRLVSSVELTEIALRRLETVGTELKAVVTVLRERALAMAAQCDAELRAGRRRSILHGIPTGVKDLLSLAGAPTTWGAFPYREQVINEDAAVVQRLDAAGAVICAKLTLGALAFGDQWFGGMTLNPWNRNQGSSGSSAGSASCVAAGVLPFAIGSETLGSIVSPSQRCRVTGLRPSLGRVTTHGAMTLSWTMDKLGPIARTAEDCALILSILNDAESDGHTPWQNITYRHDANLRGVKVGMVGVSALDEDDSTDPDFVKRVRDALVARGLTLADHEMPDPSAGLDSILTTETSAAFQSLIMSGEVDTMERSPWPPFMRAAFFRSGISYVQAQRQRHADYLAFEDAFGDCDVLLATDRGGSLLISTNLTGHPQIYLPLGADGNRTFGISLIGRIGEEGRICEVGKVIQEALPVHRLRPPGV